jgi:hypothetical protein
MKTKYKDRFSRNMLAEYIKKLKTLNIEKNPKIKAVRNYFKKAKIIVFISLFFALHGIGIIEESILKLGDYDGFNVLFGVSSKISSDTGFIIGVFLIVNAMGLMNRKKIFYYSALAIVFSFMIYLSFSLVRLREMYVASPDFHVAFFMIFYLIIYGAVFGHLMISLNEIK